MLFALTLGVGLTLVVSGFLLCLRMGTLPFLDPIVPFSPVVFIVGVMLTFYSAAVFETVPDRYEIGPPPYRFTEIHPYRPSERRNPAP